ncbi:MAG: toxin-antitoxin system YwqK family antitoxin, partial [Flavobacteriales bacterium]|nr:toxin-antitoxin system YwqK family antitoxin [Flavobacteriales bacterium]
MRNKVLNMTYLFVFLSFWNVSASQTYQIYDGDTINVVDENNMKQGHWIIFGKMKNLPDYGPDQKVEEGPYKNNRKNGSWIKYFPDESTKSEISYVNNRPNGTYKIYYENGQVQEEGIWKNNRNTGTFKRFYENGEVQQDFTFNKGGKREGHQMYGYENGEVMIEGNWAGGKEDGLITEYYADGSVKSKKYFNDGGLDAAKTETFEPDTPIVEVIVSADESKTAPEMEEGSRELGGSKTVVSGTKNIKIFDGNGFATLYNKNRQISQKGEFKNGKL